MTPTQHARIALDNADAAIERARVALAAPIPADATNRADRIKDARKRFHKEVAAGIAALETALFVGPEEHS